MRDLRNWTIEVGRELNWFGIWCSLGHPLVRAFEAQFWIYRNWPIAGWSSGHTDNFCISQWVQISCTQNLSDELFIKNSHWRLLLMRFQQLPTLLLPLLFASFLTKLVQDIKSYFASRSVFVDRLIILLPYRSDTVINKLIIFVVNTGMWVAFFYCYSFTHAFYFWLLAVWQRMYYHFCVVIVAWGLNIIFPYYLDVVLWHLWFR